MKPENEKMFWVAFWAMGAAAIVNVILDLEGWRSWALFLSIGLCVGATIRLAGVVRSQHLPR